MKELQSSIDFVKAHRPKKRDAFTRGIILAAALLADNNGDCTDVRMLISACGGVRTVLDHGDAEDLAKLRAAEAIPP